MPQASPSDIAHKELTPLLLAHSPGQICIPPSNNNTNWACLPSQQLLGKQMWQQPRTYHFLKSLVFFSRRFRLSLRHTTHFATRRISSLLMAIKSIFDNFGYIFSNFITFRLIPAETNLSRLSTQKYDKQPKVQIISITQVTAQCMNQF